MPYDIVVSLTRNVWEVQFGNAQEANKFGNDPETKSLFVSNALNVYIPRHKVLQRGIVPGVPFDINEDQLVQEINMKNSGVHAVAAKRMKRKVKNEEGKVDWVDTKSCWVDFRTKTMPEKLLMFKTRVEVTAYINQVIVCYKCGKFGHVKRKCEKEEKCLNCGQDKHTAENEVCERGSKCLNCNQNHHTLNGECKEMDKAKKIRKTMAFENLSSIEAKKKINKQSYAQAVSGEGTRSVSQQEGDPKEKYLSSYKDIEEETLDTVVEEIVQSCKSTDILKILISKLMRALNNFVKNQNSSFNGES